MPDTKRSLKVVIDGAIYSLQRAGGISRLFTEIMPRVCDYDDAIYFHLLLNNKNIQPLPKHKNIKYQNTYRIEPLLRPWRIWRFYLPNIKNEINSMLIGNSKNMLWHSTYYTFLNKWKGATVITVYDLIYERFKQTYFSEDWAEAARKRRLLAITHADEIISISHATKDDLKNIFGINDEKIKVIHLACSPIFQVIECEKNLGKPFILYLGNRSKYKNFSSLLQAFSMWPKNNEVELIVLGADWSNEEIRNIVDCKLSEKVQLIPYANDYILRKLYNQALAFIYPSLYEGFGIPLVEAMSCGCPIIASQIPSTVEVAGNVPLYHEPGSTEQLLSNLDQAYFESKSPDRILQGIERAKLFSWDRTARETANLYRDLVV